MKDLPVITKILPHVDTLWIACSGGIDSMFAAMYFNRTRDVGLAYFNHGTDYADAAEDHVREYAVSMGMPFVRERIQRTCPRGTSQEEHWRNERYQFLDTVGPAVITAHHLDDAIETWIWSSCHGKPTLPHLVKNNIYRPFLGCKKAAMQRELERHRIKWIQDPSNSDCNYTRNHIRANVIPQLYQVNPGLDTVIQKKIEAEVTLRLIQQPNS